MQTFFSRIPARLIKGLAVLSLLALFVHLGLWQAGKAERGEALRSLYDARSKLPPHPIGTRLILTEDVVFSQVKVRGEYDAAHQFYIDNQVEDGRPGVHVITPLRIEGGQTRVLVNRGWLAWADRRVAPQAKVPDGMVEIRGIAALAAEKKYLLMPERQEAWRELWSQLDIKRFALETGYTVQPVVIHLTTPGQNDALIRIIPQPEDKVAMHQGYAMQWFGMAAALLGFYLITSFRKMARSNEPDA